MTEVKQRVLDMLKTPQLANMATITLDGKPWTRYVMIQTDDDLHIRCAVCLDSRKVKQIEKNPQVHLCFGVQDPFDMNQPYVQVQGTATITADQKEKDDNWNEMLDGIFSGPQDPKYAILVVDPYRLEFNKPGTLVPEVWEKSETSS